jgi:phage I-like protein
VGAISLALAASDTPQQAEQWIHLLPAGKVIPNDGRGPWHVTSAETVIANSLAYAGARKIPIDYDHQIDNAPKNGQPAVAAGWITQLEARESGVWGLVEWTEKAWAHIAAREYRYLSPVFNHTPGGEVTRLLRAALTNRPALELTALASAADSPDEPVEALAPLRQLLNLGEEADFEAIKAAVQALQSAACAAQVDSGQSVDAAELQQALAAAESLKAQAEETALAVAVGQAVHEGRILPHHKAFAMTLCKADRTLFDDFVACLSPFTAALRGMQTGGLSPEQRGVKSTAKRLGESEQTICRALAHTEEEFIQLGVTHDH